MKPFQKTAIGALAGIVFELVGDVLINNPIPSVFFLSINALIVFSAAVKGQKTSAAFRSFVTALIFYWAFQTCVLGRTTGPGLTATTASNALGTFFLLGLWPSVALLRFWSNRSAVVLLLALFPVAFLMAASVAGAEEYLFVRKYQNTGVGPTNRWIVSMHWLSYDKDAHRLYGSD